jgi:hypothetical protein
MYNTQEYHHINTKKMNQNLIEKHYNYSLVKNNEASYDELLEIQEKCLNNAKQFKYKKNANFMLRNNLISVNNIEQKRRTVTATNRLSCEELEDLKERFVDFIKVETTSSPMISQQQQQLSSKSCAQLSYNKIKNDFTKSKPEPPERTVSIRHSTIYAPGSYAPNEMLTSEDTFTIKSAYSSYINASSCASSTTSSSSSSSTNSSGSAQPLRSCKSIFSINEDNDGQCLIKTERLLEYDITKIQSMYRSVNCIILVSSCTVDFYTTNSEQIANLQDCWKIELNSVVPVWIFDRSYKRQKEKCLKLLFVDKLTGFPVYKEILITKLSQFKNPKDRRLTFTVGNFICLINFHDYFSCNEFYKFFLELQIYIFESACINMKSGFDSSDFKATINRVRSKSKEFLGGGGSSRKNLSTNSQMIKFTDDTDIGKIKKNCISPPCAFQHINSIKNGDKHIQMLIDNKKLK